MRKIETKEIKWLFFHKFRNFVNRCFENTKIKKKQISKVQKPNEYFKTRRTKNGYFI